MKPTIRNTLNHGTISTIRASVLKMKLTRRLTASTTPLWTAACRQAGTSFPSRQQQSPAKPRQLPLPRLLLYLSRPLPAISTTMRTESALPAGEPLRAWKASARKLNFTASTSRTANRTMQKKALNCSPLTPENMPLTQRVKCRPAKRW